MLFFECWERDRMKERDEPYWPFIYRLYLIWRRKFFSWRDGKPDSFWWCILSPSLTLGLTRWKVHTTLGWFSASVFLLGVNFRLTYDQSHCQFFPYQNALIFLLSVTDISLSVIISSQRGFKQLLSLAILTCLCHRCYFFSRCDGHVLIVVWCCSLTVPRFL